MTGAPSVMHSSSNICMKDLRCLAGEIILVIVIDWRHLPLIHTYSRVSLVEWEESRATTNFRPHILWFWTIFQCSQTELRLWSDVDDKQAVEQLEHLRPIRLHPKSIISTILKAILSGISIMMLANYNPYCCFHDKT